MKIEKDFTEEKNKEISKFRIIKTLDGNSFKLKKSDDIILEMSKILKIPSNKLELIGNVCFQSNKERTDEFNESHKTDRNVFGELIEKIEDSENDKNYASKLTEQEQVSILNDLETFIDEFLLK